MENIQKLMKKRIISSVVAVVAVLTLLFTGMGAIANANNNSRTLQSAFRSIDRTVVATADMSNAQVSERMGYSHWYNRGGFSANLPRTSFSINRPAERASGTFSGWVFCDPNVTGGCRL